MTAIDPWTTLGIEPGASSEEIRAAYRALIKQHPPEVDAKAFARISDAYALVRDPQVRARERLFGPAALSHLDALADVLRAWRRPAAGRELWLDAMRERP